jgi:Tfp pilus assembly protein PilX
MIVRPPRFVPLHRQRGVTLLVAMIMMVLLTLLALTSANVSRSTIQVVGNMQSRDQNIAAARQVLEEAISSTRFFSTPSDAIGSPCGAANTRCIDVNGDDTADVTVVLTPAPACVRARSLLNEEVNVANTTEADCISAETGTFGQEDTTSGASSCSDSLWELNAVATDTVTEATAQVVQGVTVRVARAKVETSCPSE